MKKRVAIQQSKGRGKTGSRIEPCGTPHYLSDNTLVVTDIVKLMLVLPIKDRAAQY